MTPDTVERSDTLHARTRLAATARAAGHALTDLILPPQCLACDRRVAGDSGLCPSCPSALRQCMAKEYPSLTRSRKVR